ncbi:hypothetical protein EDD18DRAFT_1112142 [Armillaria luteobubalina]|uniref:Uncharacterized protein n=1 Tax=Armillaria luteobubalina TaxID=153913 RepID=A0AA39PGZ1_9AGAR|nr:hypothetical protein EDD18DRAFT_1112142 [Armillaria luteobubalina]
MSTTTSKNNVASTRGRGKGNRKHSSTRPPKDKIVAGHPTVGGKQPRSLMPSAEDPQNVAAKELGDLLNAQGNKPTDSSDIHHSALEERFVSDKDFDELMGSDAVGSKSNETNTSDQVEPDANTDVPAGTDNVSNAEDEIGEPVKLTITQCRKMKKQNTATAKHANDAHIKAAKHTLMIAEKPAMKVIMVEAPTKTQRKIQSQAAKRKHEIADQINNSLHIVYLVAKGGKHPIDEVGDTVPKCNAMLCCKEISAKKKNEIVYMHNAIEGWKKVKRQPGQTANQAGQSSQFTEHTSIKNLYYHWQCVPPNTRVHLQTVQVEKHASITDEVFDGIVKEIQLATEVLREAHITKRNHLSGEEGKGQGQA